MILSKSPANIRISSPHVRSRWKRLLGWTTALFVLLFVALVCRIEWIANRPSPVRTTITPAEIAAEDALLKQSGLVVHDGSFLEPHPFQAPWTSRSLLTPWSWSHQPANRGMLASHRVRADLLLADLDILEPVMERAYGGWDSAAARGWNWNQWFADWRKQLAAKGANNLSYDEAFAPMDALFAFQRDNHT